MIGGGMAQDETIERTKRQGILPVELQPGVDALFGMIADIQATKPVITLCPLNKAKLSKENNYYKDLASGVGNISGSGSDTENALVLKLRNAIDDRKRVIKNTILAIAADLGVTDLDINTPFREAGLDSLSMVRSFKETSVS